jgi:hypothetical protein
MPIATDLQENKIEITPVVATPVSEMAWARELYAMFAQVRQALRDAKRPKSMP